MKLTCKIRPVDKKREKGEIETKGEGEYVKGNLTREIYWREVCFGHITDR